MINNINYNINYSKIDKEFNILEFAKKQLLAKLENGEDGSYITTNTYQPNFDGIAIYPKGITGCERDEVSGACFITINEKHEPYKRYGATQLLMYVYGDTKEQAKNRAVKLINNDYEDKSIETDSLYNVQVNQILEDETSYYKYVVDKNSGELVKEYITDFIMKVECHNSNIDDEEQSIYSMSIKTRKGTFKRLFEEQSMNSIKQFNEALNCMHASYMGTSKDLINLKKYIFSKDYKEQKIVSYAGIRVIDNKKLYIERDRCLIDGKITDDYICLKDEIQGNLLDYEPITKEELELIKNDLLNHNTKDVCYKILGFSVANYFKPILKENGVSIPNLLNIGEAGSGKTTATENILKPLVGVTGKSVNAIRNTLLAYQIKTSNNTLLPFFLDDFKPNKMKEGAISAVDTILNSAYDGTSTVRGNIKLNTISYTVRTNIVMTGERMPDQSSCIERSVTSHFSKLGISDAQKELAEKRLESNEDLLRKFGRHILNVALNQESSEIIEIFNGLYEIVSDKIKNSRTSKNVAYLLLGLSMANRVLGNINLKEAMDVLIESASETLKISGATEVEKHLELIDMMFREEDPRDKNLIQYYKVDTNGYFCIRLKDIWGLLEKYSTSRGKSKPMDYKEFIKQLKSSKYAARGNNSKGEGLFYGVAKFNRVSGANNGSLYSKSAKCYKLYATELKNLELDTLLGTKLDSENMGNVIEF